MLEDTDFSDIFTIVVESSTLLILISAIITVVVLIIQSLLGGDSVGLASSISVVTTGVNALLSLVLVLIYLGIHDVQKGQEKWMEKQTEIQRRQQRLEEGQLVPVERVSVEYDRMAGDKLVFSVSNEGNGIIQGFNIHLDIFVTDSLGVHDPIESLQGQHLEKLSNISVTVAEDERGLEVVRRYLPSAGRSVHFERAKSDQSSPVIRSNETELLKVGMGIHVSTSAHADPQDMPRNSFEEATDQLKQDGYTAIGYRINYTYSNILSEETDKKLLTSGITHLSGGESFTEIFEEITLPVVETTNPFSDGRPTYKVGHPR